MNHILEPFGVSVFFRLFTVVSRHGLLVLILLGFSLVGHATTTQFSGYLRTGSGITTKGGEQICLGNPGAPPLNELRLGNECVIYGEAAMINYHLGEAGSSRYFLSQLRTAFVSPGRKSFDAIEPTDNNDPYTQFFLPEAFLEAKNLMGQNRTYWVGKRFYRENDLHMYDWYFFGDMSGNGAGVTQPVSNGYLSMAHLIQINDPTAHSDVGVHALQVLDLRWKQFEWLNEKWDLWLAWLSVKGGHSEDSDYVNTAGGLIGFKWHGEIARGFHQFNLTYGEGLGYSLNMYAPVKNVAPVEGQRWRAVDYIATDLTPSLSLMFGAAYETWKKDDSSETWQSLGLRPVFHLSDHVRVVSELGTSQIHYDSSMSQQTRKLHRWTVAAELSPTRGIWARPVLRAYISTTYWNKANQEAFASSHPSLTDKTSSTSIGWQGEVWF